MVGSPQRAFLIDLDQTLVLTEPLEALRRRRDWAAAYRAFDQTLVPPETDAFLNQLQLRGPYGVVTSAPRTYAERLLAHHDLEVPVLVAYHDTRDHKPKPAPLLLGADRLETEAGRCIHIGDSPIDEEAAHRAGMRSILVDWNAAAGPSWDDVLRALDRMDAE